MQRAERRNAEREGRAVRTLMESDYLLGVADETRLGALRFRREGEEDFLARPSTGVPALVALGRLMRSTERILRNEETDEDLQMIFAPGSSLGGARPKASVIDQHGHLSIAKFPKENDEYSIETWEEIALRLAERAGIATAGHELVQVAGKAVLLSRRFDREGDRRIPFLSAMAMLGARDGEGGSYPEMVDALASHGARARQDSHELYRRVVFNVLISNVDDHLRNHGFVWDPRLPGWRLSPLYDVLPRASHATERFLHLGVGPQGRLATLDNALAAHARFTLSKVEAVRMMADVWQKVREWKVYFERFDVSAEDIDKIAPAFRHVDEVSTPALRKLLS
jgi:serine/threonine-protein kinase HipA